MMPHYSDDWRAEHERRDAAKLKQANAAGVNIQAVMTDMLQPVPRTQEVTNKLEADKKRVK